MSASLRGSVFALGDRVPRIHESVFIAPGAVVAGDVELGEDVVVGHGVRMEGCTIEDAALIGMNSVVLHQVVVGSGAIIAAGAVLTPRTLVPPGALARGVPAQLVEADEATRDERIMRHRLVSAHYWENARRWMAELRPAGASG